MSGGSIPKVSALRGNIDTRVSIPNLPREHLTLRIDLIICRFTTVNRRWVVKDKLNQESNFVAKETNLPKFPVKVK